MHDGNADGPRGGVLLLLLQEPLPEGADELPLVVGVLVGRAAHVAVGQRGRGGRRHHLALRVVELLLVVALALLLGP